MQKPWMRLAEPLLGLAWRSPCPLCDRPGAPLLCRDCAGQLQDCRWPSPSQPGQRQTTALTPHPFPLVSWGCYDGLLKRAIAQLKYGPQPRLAQPLGAGLAEAWQRDGRGLGAGAKGMALQRRLERRQVFDQEPVTRGAVVVPVPLHPSKLRQRGFNQAEAIAESFCRQSGLPLLRRGLLRCQSTQPQFSLSPQARQSNVAQAFCLGPDLRPGDRRSVILIDDIYTTGATVAAIAAQLTQQHIRLGAVAVIAQAEATPGHDSTPRSSQKPAQKRAIPSGNAKP